MGDIMLRHALHFDESQEVVPEEFCELEFIGIKPTKGYDYVFGRCVGSLEDIYDAS